MAQKLPGCATSVQDCPEVVFSSSSYVDTMCDILSLLSSFFYRLKWTFLTSMGENIYIDFSKLVAKFWVMDKVLCQS